MHELAWTEVRDWFDPVGNGSVPDIAIEDTTLDDWQALITLIRAEGWRAEYEIGDTRVAVPRSAADFFVPDPAGSLRSLWVWPQPEIELIFRVWTPELIIADASLYELQGQERLDDFCAILRRVGRRLGKRVAMYAEATFDSQPPTLAYEVTQDRVVFLAPPWHG
ncbi:hypothetical protein ACQPZJ_26000 [Actinoplanes sp. CA-054009]